MIARVSNGVFSIGLNSKFYLVDDNNEYVIIGAPESPNIEYVRAVLEITHGALPEYLILNSCLKQDSAAAEIFVKILGTKIIAHYPDSVMLRHGECNGEKFSPIPVYLEIRNRIYFIKNFKIINSRDITPGAVIVRWNSILFIGSSKVTRIDKSIKMVCSREGCIR
ncbi:MULTISPECIES: hypothetical protein [Acidianus]|uniref:Uncharacterized protein n=1 Tax=Candidatus Acidianus copahuensis TaxID=1160895 RepID=A0A031LMW1_9CREN|nr:MULTISPECIES: hypothetical protein [Acidianus]EZQ03230.1 hypothetical protein CM19_09560 [Candidatus Acidianus copahuensis]NON62925.1 hypothetical protein [Acidianus sp. RZ1]